MAVKDTKLTSTNIPYLPLTITLAHRPERPLTLDALIDTGFTGDVSCAPEFLTNGVPPAWHVTVLLADGSTSWAPVYIGSAALGQTQSQPVRILAFGEQAAVGLNLLRHYLLTLDHGHTLTVEV